MALNKFIPISVQLALGNSKAKIGELLDQFDKFGQKGQKASDTVKGLKEGISSLSSEIIESFGLDGDIANLFGKQIAGFKASSLVIGGATVAAAGAAIGFGALTLKLANNANEIVRNSRALGLSVEQYQIYENAATVAGVATDTLTESVGQLRQRALEANKGNKEAIAGFKSLGLSATEAATAPQQSFEKLLDQLQTYPTELGKANALTQLFGGANRDLSGAIIALTDNQGSVRKSLRETGAAMNEQSAKQLTQLNRDYKELTVTVETFSKRTLVGLYQGLTFVFQALGANRLGAYNSLLESLGAKPETKGISGSAPSRAALGLGPKVEKTSGTPKGTRGGGSGSAKQTEAERLAEQLKDINREIGILSDQTNPEYKLKFQIEDARGKLKDFEELFNFQLRGKRSGTDGPSPESSLEQVNKEILDALSQQREKRLKADEETAKKEKEIAELVADTTEALREQLAELRGEKPTFESEARKRLKKGGATEQQSEEAIAAAKAADAQQKYNDALDQARERQEQYVDFVRTQFDNLLEGPKQFFDGLKQLFKRSLSDILTNLFTGGSGGGGKSSLTSLLTGGGGGGGGILSNLFRTPGFNPAAGASGATGAASGGGGGLASAFSNGGVSGLLQSGVGKVAASLGPKLAGLFGGGASSLGGGISIGVGGGTAGAGGGALLGSLGALASNPITIGVAAAIGGYLLYRHFKKRGQYSRDVKKAVQSQYGVEVSKDVIGQIKSIGQSKYGKDYANRVNETVSSPEVRDLVADYAENTGQKGNASLFNAANLSDPTYRDNRFVTSEAGRGNAFGVGGGFVGTPSIGSSTPNIVQAAQIGAQSLLADAITMLTEKITSIPAAELIIANANAVGVAFKETFSNDSAIGEQIGRAVNP